MVLPSGRDSKRDRFLKAIQLGYDKVINVTKLPPHPASLHPGSTPTLSGSDMSIPLGIPTTPNHQLTSLSSNAQDTSASSRSTGSSIQGAGLTPGTTLSTCATYPEPTVAGTFTEHRILASSGLKTALQVLEKSAHVLPPLKEALGGLIGCLDIVQARIYSPDQWTQYLSKKKIQSAAAYVEDYQQLTSEFTTMANTLSQYIAELGPEASDSSARRIAQSIEAEVERVNTRQGRSMGRRMVGSAQDQEAVIKSYRKIEGLFRELQSDIGLRTWKNTSKLHVTLLLQGMSPVEDARYNSSYSSTVKRCGCTAETREKVRTDIQNWICDPNGARIYWMNGMAGTGKTTIAYSLCEWLEANQRLGASFFCSRVSPSCRNVNLIVPTIAYQLALASLVFRSALCKVLEADPGTSKLNVVRQFDKLVRMPLLGNKDVIARDLVVVIDALDECEDDYGVRLILGTLLKLGIDLPLKFLVTSRPEPAIRDNMLSSTGYSPAVLHLHDIEQSLVEGDIKKYLVEALDSVSPHPSIEQIERLATISGKLFIYAATAVRYITSGKGNPIARLNSILAPDRQPIENEPSVKRYKELDELYKSILSAALNDEELEEEETEATQLVLWTVVCAKEPLTAPALASLIDLSKEQILVALEPLHSVLHVSEDRKLVSTLHASFPDYMFNQRRSKSFYCDGSKQNQFIARRCFEVMKEQLRFNICRLESSLLLDVDVHDLGQRIDSYISPTLVYACRYWGDHLQLTIPSNHDDLCKRLGDFLEFRILFWMEVMNLKRCIVEGISALAYTEIWLSAMNVHKEIQRQATDARDFVARFSAGAGNRSTPHIYLSALPFCPRTSTVYATYRKRTRGLLEIHGAAITQRERAAQATWNIDSAVLTLACSHDSMRIASGSIDETVRVWDSRTGELVAGPLEGHTGWVNSVTFSPDGIRIASGSDDTTIRVWDARTGHVIAGPFNGHTDSVNSVVFSPDGARIASGSADTTIQVWDSRTGDVVAGPFEGHTDSVTSVAFSSDSSRIVSGSDDTTVQVWDSYTGNVVAGPFNGHTDSVNSVAFSPDGTGIASGSADATIRVWDSCTGDVVAGPFRGHTDSVNSVAFSHDGSRIVSGSKDATIQVWDAHTSNMVAGPFIGHIHWVNSVAFSPDATRIISGSSDMTIQVWNASVTNIPDRRFQGGHTNWVNSVAFSSDKTRIASGSYDGTIGVWNVYTSGTAAGLFKAHTASVNSVMFSPDGKCIVSGSDDTTIRVWDARTGDIVAGPFNGHTDSIHSVAFSPDGVLVASGSADATIQVWDSRTGDIVAGPFNGHTDSVNSVAFSPDGTRITSGSDDTTIRVWDACTGHVVAGPFNGHTGSIESVSFSPNGTCVVSGSADTTIQVRDSRTGDVVAGPFKGHTNSVNSVMFSVDGTLIVSGSADTTIQVWDVRTGDVVAGPFKGHTDSVTSVAFSPDGVHIVSGSKDQAIRVSNIDRACVNAESYRQLLSQITTSCSNTQDTFKSDRDNKPHGPLTDIQDLVSNPSELVSGDVSAANMDFECHTNGWVTSNGTLLFWTPPDLRSHIPYPQDEFVIGVQGSLSIGYQNILLGERWTECYISP